MSRTLDVAAAPTRRRTTRAAPTARLLSLDIVRGVVMVLMAIDHVRVYSGVPPGGPTPGVFFTRWVTHFCAPAFVFLAGTAAFLYGTKLDDRRTLAKYLVLRGALLVLLELTVIRASWTFGFDYSSFILAGVIWMLGWCMMLMAGLVFLPVRVIAAFGMIVIFAQDVIRPIARATPDAVAWMWQFLYLGGEVELGANGPVVSVLYSIVPWIGVMAVGYAFASIMLRDPAERHRLCLAIGLSATVLFLVAGSLEVTLRTVSDDPMPWLLQLLNQRKYPASQWFLLMTLGPTIALLPAAERMRGWVGSVLATFGRVPMFYYLLHIPLIHATALLVWLLRDGRVDAARFAIAPYVSVPPDEQWGLPLLYLVFAIVVTLLYGACRWFASVKARRPGGWLRYL